MIRLWVAEDGSWGTSPLHILKLDSEAFEDFICIDSDTDRVDFAEAHSILSIKFD